MKSVYFELSIWLSNTHNAKLRLKCICQSIWVLFYITLHSNYSNRHYPLTAQPVCLLGQTVDSCRYTGHNSSLTVWVFTCRMTERMRALTGPVKDSVTPAPWKHHNTIPPLLKMAKKSSISASHERTQYYEEQNKHRSTKNENV